MKRGVFFAVVLLATSFPAWSFPYGSVSAQGGSKGKAIVRTIDVEGNGLGKVSFTLDGKGRRTNAHGERKLTVTAGKTHTLEFGEAEGYTLLDPEDGLLQFSVKAGKTRIIEAIYEQNTLPVTPTPVITVTPTPLPVITTTPTVSVTPTPTPGITATITATPTPVTIATATPIVSVTPTPGTAVIPWQMFHYNSQHIGQSAYNGPKTNTLKWKYMHPDTDDGTVPNSMCVDSKGVLYVTAANKLLALDSRGELQWSADIGGTGGTALSSDESTIYAAAKDNLYAVSSFGKQLWVFTDPTENVYGEPNVGSDGVIYIGSWDTYVYAVNADGSLKWKYQTNGAIAPLASPTLSLDGKTLYVGSGDPNKDEGGTLYALNCSDGKVVWQVDNLDKMRVSGPVVGPNGTIYATGGGRLNAFDKDGKKLWESSQDTASSLAPSLASDGTLYSGTGKDGKVYAIDSSNGQTKWSYQTGKNPNYTGNPKEPEYGVLATIVIGADGILYVGAMDGKIHALNNKDGSALWTYQTGKHIHENCPAIGPDGSLYFSSADKYIYVIKDN